MNRKSILVWVLLVGSICAASAQTIIRPKISCPNGVYVNSYNGVLFYQRTDLQIPNRGLNLEAIFYYNSSANRTNYGYGNGWSIGMEMRYIPDSAGIIIEQGDGRQDLYTRSGNLFEAPAGVFNTLSMVGDGYQLKTKGGTRYLFTDTVSKRITRIVDRNNNALNLTYTDGHLTAVSDTTGRTLLFEWTDTLMTRMTTSFDNRSWTYQYDENGNLAHVTDPMQRTVHYGYNGDNRLSVLTDAAGYSTYVTYNGDGMAHRVKTDLSDKSIRYEQALKQTVFIDYLTDGNNQFSTYYWDDEGRVIEKKGNCCGFSSKLTYDDQNNVRTLEDANGHVTHYDYDQRGNVISVTDALGNSQYFTYESTFNNILSFTDKKGNVYHFSYDDRGNLTEMRTPLNTTASFTYNNWGQVLTATDANGNVTTYAYDDYGNLISLSDALGNTNTMTYNIAGNLTSTRDPYQAETRMTYNNADELIRMVDPLGNAMQMSYDSRGAITAMTDAKQQVTHFTYDALRQPISITGPMNNTVTTTYNAKQKPTQMVDAMNNAVKRVYDDHDWLSYVVDVLGDTTWFSYDNMGQVIGIQMPNGQELTYQYDALDRLIVSGDRIDTTAQYLYDVNSNLIEGIDGEGKHSYFAYDAMNRLIQVTDADGGTYQYTYDANGNVLTYTDANGHTTTFVYDALNRQVGSTDALGHTTTHVYDANGNTTSVTDSKGQTTSYTYDANGQLTQIAFADGKTRTFEYDGNGNVIRQKDEANRYMTFAYDALDRLNTKTYPDNSTHQFTYDLNGNMLSAVNANATVQFTYDAAGQVLSETLNGKSTTYSYNTHQRTMGITYPGGRSITEQYDYRGRLAAVVENESSVVSFNYNNNNFLMQRTYQNGTASNYTYDLLNRLTRIMDNPQVMDVEMTYDAVGNILSKKDLLHPTKSEAYTYDALNQLIGFKKGAMTMGVEIPNPMQQIQYVLDAVGNHTTVTEDGQTTTYTANSRNAYSAVSGNSSYTPQYDLNGNLAQDDHHTYTYDFDNHLISVDNGNTATYTYDALGRRICKQIGSTVVNYYYAGDQIVEERNIDNTVTATYLYGIGIDDILQMHRNGQDYWYHKNHLGSVVALTDGYGSVVERYEYDPYGKLTIYNANDSVLAFSAVGNIYYFTGREYDFETGLYHYRARSLHPVLGRFMQHDPLLYADAMGLYQYVENMPTRMVDPWGNHVYVFIWTSGNPQNSDYIGHSAMAVSQYDANGELTKYYAFYDKWPKEGVFPENLKDVNSLFSDVAPFHHNDNNRVQFSESELDEFYYSVWDRYEMDKERSHLVPDAIVKIETNYEIDMKIINKLKEINNYNAASNNCSNYVSDALKAGGITKPNGDNLGKEFEGIVTPNQLWKDILKYVPKNKKDKFGISREIKHKPGKNVNKKFIPLAIRNTIPGPVRYVLPLFKAVPQLQPVISYIYDF
jgi:RHS repeat-associated protein